MGFGPLPEPSLPIPPNEALKLKHDQGTVRMALAKAFGVGGSEWSVRRATGGDTGPAAEDTIGSIRAYIVSVKDLAILVTASHTNVPTAEWQLVAPGAPPINEGDALQSTTQPSFIFVVQGLSYNGRDTTGIVEKI